MEWFNIFVKIIDSVGYFAPYVLGLFSILLLIYRRLYTCLVVYSVGYGLNTVINLGLKGIIKEPRPSEDQQLFSFESIGDKRISMDRFGMPSGHSQSVFYSTLFIWFAIKNVWITLCFFLISMISVYQRIKYKNHTWKQVFLGAILGSVMGSAVFTFSQQQLRGSLKPRKEDWGPRL